jgi:FAD/FMN-containing dehydrogenase
MAIITRQTVEKIEQELQGSVSLPEDPRYEKARTVWNGMIDRRPAAVVHCASADDVARTIRFARDLGLELSVRGGGHHIAGNAVCDGGVMIDLSEMNSVLVDADRKRAYVGPGATLGDFDGAAQQHALATPVGINSTTGISGLTLGGGFGWLTRKHGMTVDNLVSAQIVTANGEKLPLSESENQDLFWAIRGGGGNFGVVTQYEFRLHAVGPEVLAGLIVFPMEQAKQVLQQYRDFVASAPEELNVWVVLRLAPPLPFLPADVHNKPVIVLAVFHAGDLKAGERRIAPLRDFGRPYGQHIGTMQYVEWQKAFDPLLTPGARNYWKSHNFAELKDEAVDVVTKFAGTLPSDQCEIFIGLIAGAANHLPADAMAYANRDARFVLNVHARWDEVSRDQDCMSWARTFFDAAKPYASRGAYVNFMTGDESDRVAAAYGSNYARLARIKKQYDPDNIFHMNQNIKAS